MEIVLLQHKEATLYKFTLYIRQNAKNCHLSQHTSQIFVEEKAHPLLLTTPPFIFLISSRSLIDIHQDTHANIATPQEMHLMKTQQHNRHH